MKNVLRSPFSVLRSPFSVLRSPFSVLMVMCLFCTDISAQLAKKMAPKINLEEQTQMLLTPCGGAARFTKATYVSGNECCAQFTAINDAEYTDITWSFGDGSSSTSPTSVYHCYSQSLLYTVIHTVKRDDGSICSSSQLVDMTTCRPCPQLTGIAVSTGNAIPYGICSGFAGGQNDLTGLGYFCPFKFTPILNGSSAGLTFNWAASLGNYPSCNLTASSLNIGFDSHESISGAVTLTVTGGGCAAQTMTKIFTKDQGSCGYSLNLKDPSNDNVQSLLRKITTDKNLKVYPNPIDNLLHLSNLKDSEDYTFEIHNALGQTVLTQKVSSIDAVIDVSNLTQGVYISVLKSQGKIISNNKIYKK
jgi:Secretion system C-terminal sorting domain/PKD domain